MSFKVKIFLITMLLFTFAASVLLSQEKTNLQRKFDGVRKKFNFAQGFQNEQKNPRAQELLNKAGMNLRRANRQMRGRRPFVANRSIKEADKAINQALKIFLKEPMIKRKKKLDELAKRAENIVIGSENVGAQKALDSGLKNKDFAYEAYRRNNFFRSMRFYNQAYQHLLKAISLVTINKRDIGIELENEAYRFDQFLEFNKGIINSSKNQTVIKFKESARKKVRDAEHAKLDGDFQLAIDYYQEATRLLNRALDITLGKTELSVKRVFDKVARLDELVDNMEQRYDRLEPDEQITIWMSRIKQLQKQAHQAVAENNFGIALNKAQLALDLVNKIHKKTRELK